MSKVKRVWNNVDGMFLLGSPSREFGKLENVIYNVGYQPDMGFYLTKDSDAFGFPYKIYGLENDFIGRVLKSYSTLDSNLGVLLNGLKGTGKTVTSKIISNNITQPTILISKEIPGLVNFVNNIPENITVLIDEYEKVFEESSSLLTVMDGMSNSNFKRLFLLTTNSLRIEPNLIDRPSRIRYLKTYDNLKADVVEEIINDLLENKDYKEDVLEYITRLELITVDVVKTIIMEVNIHNEIPEIFKDVFNAKTIEGKYNIHTIAEDGTKIMLVESIANHNNYDEDFIGNSFYINNDLLGYVNDVIAKDTLVIKPVNSTYNGLIEPITIVITPARTINQEFVYGGYSFSINKQIVSPFCEQLLEKQKERKNSKSTEFGMDSITQELSGN